MSDEPPDERVPKHAAPDDQDVGGIFAASSDEPERKRGFFRRHIVLTSFLALVTLLVGGVVAFGFYVNSKLSNVDTYVSQVDPEDRVPKSEPASGPPPINLLLLGADASAGKSIAQQLAAGEWDSGSMRSDAIMLVHIPSNRSHVYVTSFPRDSWVQVPGHGSAKINAAFSFGGPDLALQTVEQLTNVHIDHVAMIDWQGFKGLTDALGGVTINIPGEGAVKMDGEKALEYVRTRKALPNGDFDRVKRQQNFLRALMAQTFDSLSITDPLMLVDILTAVANNTTVDSTLTPEVMRSLAWDLRGIKSGSVSFMTVPNAGTGYVGDQSVVHLDLQQAELLFQALREDKMPTYMNDHKVDSLPPPDAVN